MPNPSATFVDPDELDTPEVVAPDDTMPGQGLMLHTGGAVEQPDPIPHEADLLALAQLANTFARAELVPKALQGKPADVLLILLTARDLGLPATVALRECHPIDGRVTISPKLKLAIVRERKLGRVWPDQANDLHEATWYASRADDPETVYSGVYTWEDAQRAGLVGRACTATEHKQGCKCKRNWMTYPGQMLQWRAIGYLMDQAFGEVGTGLYGPDELGAVTDEEGRIIDVAEVGDLPGMEVPEKPAPAPELPADPDVLWLLQARIQALPDEHRAKMAERWKDSGRLTWERDGKRYPFRPHELPAKAVASAESMVTGFEKLAERDGWNAEEALTRVLTGLAPIVAALAVPTVHQEPATPATAPVDGLQDAPRPDGPPEPAEPQEGTQQPAPTGPFDRQATARWLDSLDDLTIADMLNEYELAGGGTKVAKRRRVLDFLEQLASPEQTDPGEA